MVSNPYIAPKSKPGPGSENRVTYRSTAYKDAVMFLVMTLLLCSSIYTFLQFRDVDASGIVFAAIYLAPSALLFLVATLALYHGWRYSRVWHWISWAFALLPPLIGLAAFIQELAAA